MMKSAIFWAPKFSSSDKRAWDGFAICNSESELEQLSKSLELSGNITAFAYFYDSAWHTKCRQVIVVRGEASPFLITK